MQEERAEGERRLVNVRTVQRLDDENERNSA